MYVIIGYHGLDDQCVAVGVVNVVCVLITKSDIVHLTLGLLGRPLVRRVRTHERFFPCFSEIAILGSSGLPSEVRSTEDGLDFAGWSRLVMVVVRLGTSVADVVSEIPFTDEFFNLILEHNALFDCVANIFVKSTILILISFGAVSS